MRHDKQASFREGFLRPEPSLAEEPVILYSRALRQTRRKRICFVAWASERDEVVFIGKQGRRSNTPR